jgi:hypothetical protein
MQRIIGWLDGWVEKRDFSAKLSVTIQIEGKGEAASGMRGEEGDVGGYDAPAFGEADPGLGLAAVGDCAVGVAFELQSDAAVAGAEGDDVEAEDFAGEVGGGAASAKGFELFDAVEVFRDSEAHDAGGGPEHGGEGFDVVADEGALVVGVEGLEFGDGSGVVDGKIGHGGRSQKSFLGGRMALEMEALTVVMGRLTTWLSLRSMATLESR